MKRLRIGFDLDGVLADFAGWYLGRAKELWPDFAPKPEWSFGLVNTQQDELWAEIRATENFWQKLRPIVQDTVTLRTINERHTLLFITSREPTLGRSVEMQSALWLSYKLQILYPTVLVVDHWHEKPALYRDLHLDAYIDDKPETVVRMISKDQNCYAFDQPWNQGILAPRVRSVEEYVATVEAKLG